MSDYTVWFTCPECDATFSSYEYDIEVDGYEEYIVCPECEATIWLERR